MGVSRNQNVEKLMIEDDCYVAGERGGCTGLRRLSAHNLSTTEPSSFNDPDYDTDSILRPQQ